MYNVETSIIVNEYCFCTYAPNGKTDLIGHIYPIFNKKGVLKRDGYCQQSIHYFIDKKPIPQGTEIDINGFYQNFYGGYFVTSYNGVKYYIATKDVEIIK